MTSDAATRQLCSRAVLGAVDWDIVSAGRVLRVSAAADLADRWPELSRHVTAEELRAAASGPARSQGGARVATPALGPISSADLRRRLNALLHCLHLGGRTLTVHGVAMRRDDRAVVLLGGHGAGKTLVGLALALRGWGALAGDAVLMELSAPIGPARLVGGSTAFLARPAAVLRWFSQLGFAFSPAAQRVDLVDNGLVAKAPFEGISGVAAVLVDVDGDPRIATDADVEALEGHTGASLWYGASGHVLDRVLDDVGGPPLRVLETPELARTRLTVTSELAVLCPVTLVRGSPHAIAAAVHHLTDEGSL